MLLGTEQERGGGTAEICCMSNLAKGALEHEAHSMNWGNPGYESSSRQSRINILRQGKRPLRAKKCCLIKTEKEIQQT